MRGIDWHHSPSRIPLPRRKTVVKWLVSAIALVTFIVPALADEYWVQYDYSSHECSIVLKKSNEDTADKTSGAPTADTTTDAPTADTTTDAPTADTTTGAPTADATKGAPTADNSSETGTPNASNGNSTSDDTEITASNSPVVAAWQRKEAAAKEKNDTSTTALIGSPMKSREEAENEETIMRKCGIAN
jgi:hypothetical protein